MRRVTACIGLTALACLAWLVAPAAAHELRPAIATVSFNAPGELRLELTLNLEALVAGIGAGHEDTSQSANAADYDRLRALAPADLQTAFERFSPQLLDGIELTLDGNRADLQIRAVDIPETGDTDLARISTIRLAAGVPANAETLVWRLEPSFGDSVIRLAKGGATDGAPDITYAVFLSAGVSEEVSIQDIHPQSVWSVFSNYLIVGFEHIVPKGLDHILFVVGLFLLSPRLKPLLWQVTSFTLAHSITLALAMGGIVQAPPSIVEPLIAASIVYVAVENMMTDRLQSWRPVVVFCFGLLHGLGFAGVLTEIGLQPAHFISGLVAFNLGVELGQLTVLAACFLFVGLWFRSKPWYRARISIPGSAAIALTGFYWFVTRIIW